MRKTICTPRLFFLTVSTALEYHSISFGVCSLIVNVYKFEWNKWNICAFSYLEFWASVSEGKYKRLEWTIYLASYRKKYRTGLFIFKRPPLLHITSDKNFENFPKSLLKSSVKASEDGKECPDGLSVMLTAPDSSSYMLTTTTALLTVDFVHIIFLRNLNCDIILECSNQICRSTFYTNGAFRSHKV